MGYFKCWSVKNVLDLYVDGRLGYGAKRKIAEHLGTCSGCRALKEELSPLSAEDLGKIDVPEGLAESILKELGKEGAPSRRAPALGEVLAFSPAKAAALAYCALLAAGHTLPGGLPSQADAPLPESVLEAMR